MLRPADPPVVQVAEVPLLTREDQLSAAPADDEPGQHSRSRLGARGDMLRVVAALLPGAAPCFVVLRVLSAPVADLSR